MKDVLSVIDSWQALDERVAIATVVSVARSAPRPPGAKMAISSSGRLHGQVSGGCVEGAVVNAAQEVLEGGPPRLLLFGITDADAWNVGLPCGGEIGVWVSEPNAGLIALARADGRGALVTRLDDGRSRLVDHSGDVNGTLGDPELDKLADSAAGELMWAERSELRELAGIELFVDAVFPAPRLIIIGAADIAVSLCAIARLLYWRPYICDPRAFFAQPERFPDAEELIADWPDAAIERLGGLNGNDFVVVLSHDPKIDDKALSIALRSDARYIGAMGSRRAQQARRERLTNMGFTDADLDRLAGPVGLDINALTAEETALSIAAEILAVCRGRQGGRLRNTTGRIHSAAV